MATQLFNSVNVCFLGIELIKRRVSTQVPPLWDLWRLLRSRDVKKMSVSTNRFAFHLGHDFGKQATLPLVILKKKGANWTRAPPSGADWLRPSIIPVPEAEFSHRLSACERGSIETIAWKSIRKIGSWGVETVTWPGRLPIGRLRSVLFCAV